MGNCKGNLSKSEKKKFREDAYVKNIGGEKIDHGSDEPTVHSKADIDENEENIDRNEIDRGKEFKDYVKGIVLRKKTKK
jgi:hypothetical protein